MYFLKKHAWLLLLSGLGAGCQTAMPDSSFGKDLEFLRKHQSVLLLQAEDNPDAQVAVVGAWQGRVMTSTATGAAGSGYGWINQSLISKGTYQPHINAYGGEDRFWLSPEGGQYSVFFEKGKDFTFDNWQTPPLIDTVAFETVTQTAQSASFRKRAMLENHSGTSFDIEILRKIRVFSRKENETWLGTTLPEGIRWVGYESENTLVNHGADWQKDTGLLGVWILGMFTPAPATTIVAPYHNELQLTDNYFGKVPDDRLRKGSGAVFLRADGKYRSKIGLTPGSTTGAAGSYDAARQVLTLVQFDVDAAGDYLKSTWEHHAEPYHGDAFNAYNDGPLADGSQMGPFYELESSSSVKPLKKGGSLTHHHRTFHLEGSKETLDAISRKVLGVSLAEIEKAF